MSDGWVIAASIARLLRLGEVLHRHGVPAPLRGFLERAEQPARPERTCVAWELAVGAADALVRRGDAETLRSLREPYGSARYHAIQSVLSRKDHDEETVLWIADHLEHHYDEVLESIVGRPERREFAKRWARDTSRPRSFRRHAAARWLLTHPSGGEHAHVCWVFTELPVGHALHYVDAALAHPDEAIGAAAIALLPRALAESGADADLASVVRRFSDSRPNVRAQRNRRGAHRAAAASHPRRRAQGRPHRVRRARTARPPQRRRAGSRTDRASRARARAGWDCECASHSRPRRSGGGAPP